MRRLFSLIPLFAVATIMSAAACADSPTEPGEVAGLYVLQSINGSPPPVTVVLIPGYQLDVLSATLDLHTSLSYTLTSELRETENQQTSQFVETDVGTWSVAGRTITLVDTEGRTTSARIQGTQLLLDEGGVRLVFVR